MIEIIVPVSGGKDSQACLKLAVESHGRDKVLGLFHDTKWEHPLTYKHIDKMEALYGVEIIRGEHPQGKGVEDLVREIGKFPIQIARFCTDRLKMRTSRDFLKEFSKDREAPLQLWLGVRTGEGRSRKAKYANFHPDDLYPLSSIAAVYPQYLEKRGVMGRLPIVDWTTEEVFEFLEGQLNPLYSQGFDRVGCFPCLAAGDKNKIKAFEHDEFGKGQYIKVLQLEEETGDSVFRYDVGKSWSCDFCNI